MRARVYIAHVGGWTSGLGLGGTSRRGPRKGRKMKIVSCYGGLWKLSNKQYAKLLADVAAGKTFDLDAYGKQFGQIDLNALDLDARLAKELLPTTMSWKDACAATLAAKAGA